MKKRIFLLVIALSVATKLFSYTCLRECGLVSWRYEPAFVLLEYGRSDRRVAQPARVKIPDRGGNR